MKPENNFPSPRYVRKKITKRKFVADGDDSSIPVAEQKALRNLVGYLEFFYLFVSRFLSEPITMFCGCLVGEQLAVG